MATQQELESVFEGLYAEQGNFTKNAERLGRYGSVSLESLAALGMAVPVTVDLDAQQIADSNGTPVEIVPAPGAGKWWRLHDVTTEAEPGINPFEFDSTAEIYYDGDDENIMTGFYPSVASSTAEVSCVVVPEFERDRTLVENKALVIKVTSSLTNDGNTNTCRVTLLVSKRTFP